MRTTALVVAAALQTAATTITDPPTHEPTLQTHSHSDPVVVPHRCDPVAHTGVQYALTHGLGCRDTDDTRDADNQMLALTWPNGAPTVTCTEHDANNNCIAWENGIRQVLSDRMMLQFDQHHKEGSACINLCEADDRCNFVSYVLQTTSQGSDYEERIHWCGLFKECLKDTEPGTAQDTSMAVIQQCVHTPAPTPAPAPPTGEPTAEPTDEVDMVNERANANTNQGWTFTAQPTLDFSTSTTGGALPCLPWQACWTPAPPPTSPPTTDSPTTIASTSGDPFTSYNGKKTQFWTTAGVNFELIQCGTWQLRASVFDAGEHQWFKDMQIVHAKEPLANFTVLPTQKQASAVRMQTAEWQITEVGQMKMLRGGGSSVNGVAAPARYEVRAAASASDQYPGFQTVTVLCEEEGQHSLGFEVGSAPANKMEEDKDALRYAHLDLNFLPTFNASNWCTGVLPEIWGLQPLSEKTSKMLVPPKKGAADANAEEAADE